MKIVIPFSRQTFILTPVIALSMIFVAAIPATAQDIWTGADATHSTNWTDATNWQALTAPLPYDTLDFSGSVSANSNDFPNGTAFDGITFDGAAGAAFNLTGNSILLSGNYSGNYNGVINNSSFVQRVGLNLNLDWGFYTFTGGSSGIGLNGMLTPNAGGVAWFDSTVSSGSLSVDATTGLINGLEGAGLVYSDGANTPSGLATLSGGSVVAYSGFTSVASGAISSGNNILLTASGAAAAYTANNVTINTLTVAQTGNSGGTDTSTLTLTGALTLGTNGGIYLLGNTLGSKGCFSIANGGHITAGTSGPATMLLAINGNNANNEATIACAIQNNAGGGAVTVVTTGPGSLNFGTSTSNNYSGGTYVTEGQLQFSQFSQLGTGPVYVASNADLYYTGTGTVPNNLYLSPGFGSPTANVVANAGALSFSGDGLTFSGTVTLLGAPVTTAPGCRINNDYSSGDTITFSGQITGTGTLDVWGSHTCNYLLANTNTNTPNNWQGGLILEAHAGVAANTYFKMGANNQIPSGPSAGNVTLIPATSAVYARLDLNGYNATINGLNSSSGGTFAQIGDFGTANSTLTLGANNATASFSGSSSDGAVAGKELSIVKIGTGTQTFSGTLSHYGSTIVSNGTLMLEGTMPNSQVTTVAPGALLDISYQGFTVGASQALNGTGAINGSPTVNGTIAAIMAVSGVSTNIGTLTMTNATLALNGGSTNLWYINNASGTAGGSNGWSLVNLGADSSLSLNANASTPIHLKIVSLNAAGSPGSAAFSPNGNQSWTLIQSSSPIAGFTGSGQFVIDTSGFANLPSGASQFSVGTNATGDNLVLYYTSAPVITNALVNQTNNAGTTAVFTVGAAGPGPITYQWLEGTSVLTSGGVSASGAPVTITTNAAGTTSTLTIAGVEDADAGAISVDVTNSSGGVGISSASLTVIDAPSNPNVSESGAQNPVNAGGVTHLTVATLGTAPFTYVWSFNGSVISGATSSVLNVNDTTASAGTYMVVVSNQAGSVTSSPTVLSPVTTVPNQLIYEPFTSYAAMSGPQAPYTWEGVTNVYNQLTGEPAYWQHESGSRISLVIVGNPFNSFTENNSPGYPWPGLAGDSSQCGVMEVNSSETDNDQMYFWSHGLSPGQSLYFSFLLNCDTLGSANVSDVIAAFCDSSSSTSFNLKLSTEIQTDGSYWLGLSKGSGTTGNQGVDASTLWATGFQADQAVFVVGLYQAYSGVTSSNDDTVSMWFNPTNSTFGTTNVPTPNLGPSTFGVNNSGIHAFSLHGVQLPGNRYISDLRIGTTWASVTPIAAPNLTLSNVYVTPGAPSATFTSENAGNPVITYQWYFNGTNASSTNGTALTDGPNPTGDGSYITNSATAALTIIGPTAADLGTYTVAGYNTDLAPADNGATLAGTAFATLNFLQPTLRVAVQSADVVISWPSNFAGFTLQETTNLSPSGTWANVPTNSYGVSGTNSTFTVSPSGASSFFRLIGP